MLREIKCDLTTEELLRKGQEMAQLQRDKELVEMEKKESAAEFKGKIDALESKLSRVCSTIRDKYEMRQVNCREVKDFVNKVRRIIRCDNEEEIEVHPMTPADLQQKLPKVDVASGAPRSEQAKQLPVTFEDADVGMVWLSSVLGEVEIVARADDSVVVRQVSGSDTARITKEMWGAHKMTFVRFVQPPSVAGALPQTATPEKVEPGQIWHAYGYQFEVLSILKDGDVEVKYIHDNMRSIMSENEWKAAAPVFVAIRGKVEVVEQTDEPIPGEKKPGKKRGKRGAK